MALVPVVVNFYVSTQQKDIQDGGCQGSKSWQDGVNKDKTENVNFEVKMKEGIEKCDKVEK